MNSRSIIGRLLGGPADGVRLPLEPKPNEPTVTVVFTLPRGHAQYLYQGALDAIGDSIDLQFQGPVVCLFEDE